MSSDAKQQAETQRQYELFKLQWMIDHGYTLREIMAGLDQYMNERIDDLSERIEEYGEDCDINADDLKPSTIFDEWELDSGFAGGEIYPCFEEWFDNEGSFDNYEE